MERYKNLIHNNIQAFISNYLIDGVLTEVRGLADLDAVIYEKYPYMSIAYLLKENSLIDDYTRFIENHRREIESETSSLRNIFGDFLRLHNNADTDDSKEKIDEDKEYQSKGEVRLPPIPVMTITDSFVPDENATSTRIRIEKVTKDSNALRDQDGSTSRLIIAENFHLNTIDVYDMNLNLLASDLRAVKGSSCYYDPNMISVKSYRIGYSAKDSMLYFM